MCAALDILVLSIVSVVACECSAHADATSAKYEYNTYRTSADEGPTHPMGTPSIVYCVVCERASSIYYPKKKIVREEKSLCWEKNTNTAENDSKCNSVVCGVNFLISHGYVTKKKRRERCPDEKLFSNKLIIICVEWKFSGESV